jgi:putative flippase GtrA
MTFGPSRISAAVKSRLQTSVGKRFSRFLLVAVGAVIASQVLLTICLGPLGLTAGKSAVAAWFTGAVVSYVLSRWAWERKGRPNLLKETLPFGVVAIGTAIVLTLTAKWANHQAIAMGLNDTQQVLFVDACYFLANCVTFLTRFLIFHYVLFRDRGSKLSELVSELPASEFPGARPGVTSSADEGAPSDPLAADGSAGRVNGSPILAAAERSPGRAPTRDEAALPEPGTRR